MFVILTIIIIAGIIQYFHTQMTNTPMEIHYLFDAIQNNDYEKVKQLVETDVYLDERVGWHKRTPLHYAIINGNYEISKLLIENDADLYIEDRWYKYQPLHYAAKKGHIDIVKLLIKKGVDVDLRGKNDDAPTALSLAFENRHFEMVKFLINEGAYIDVILNDDFDTPLHWCIKNGDFEMAKFLIKNGANTQYRNSSGKTALNLALDKNYSDLVKCIRASRKSKGK